MTTLQKILTVDEYNFLFCDIYVVPKLSAKTGKETCSWFQRKQWKEVQSLLIPPLQQNLKNDEVLHIFTEELKCIKGGSLELTFNIKSFKNEIGMILCPISDGNLWEQAWKDASKEKKEFNNFGGLFAKKKVLKNILCIYVKYLNTQDDFIDTAQEEDEVKKSSYFKPVSSLHSSTPQEKTSIRRIVREVMRGRRCRKKKQQNQSISSFLKVSKAEENIHLPTSDSCSSATDNKEFVSHEDFIASPKNISSPICKTEEALNLQSDHILSDDKTNLCEDNLGSLSSESTVTETPICTTYSNETEINLRTRKGLLKRTSASSAKLAGNEKLNICMDTPIDPKKLTKKSNCKQRLKLRKQSKGAFSSKLSRKRQKKNPVAHPYASQNITLKQCLASVKEGASDKRVPKRRKKIINIKHSVSLPDLNAGILQNCEKIKVEKQNRKFLKSTPVSKSKKSDNVGSSEDNNLSCQSNLSESLSRSLTKSRIAAALEMRGYGQKEMKQTSESDQEKEDSSFHDDEELNKAQIQKELQSIMCLKKLQKSHLKHLFQEKLPYLMNIFKEKIFCRRHTDFMKGGKANVSLTYQVYTLLFSEKQIDYLMEKLIDVFCKDNSQDIDYVLKVILPELLICIYMTLAGTDHDESDELMARGLFKKHS